MSANAHIFNPNSDSLADRIAEYQHLLQVRQNAQQSLDLLHNKEWANRLGSKEDIEYALQVSENGLNLAVSSIKKSEIAKAQKSQLLSDSEIKELLVIKNKQELGKIRQTEQLNKNHSFRKKP